MDALERITVLMTLMRRLGQVMERESALLRGMRLDALEDLQQEKGVLAEAYEIELRRLRGEPELMSELDPAVREELTEAMRAFQDRLRANRLTLEAAREVVEKVIRHIGDDLAKSRAPGGYGGRDGRGGRSSGGGGADTRGQVISLALDREI